MERQAVRVVAVFLWNKNNLYLHLFFLYLCKIKKQIYLYEKTLVFNGTALER